MAASPLEQCWYAVSTVDEIGAEPLSIELLDLAYVIWRGPAGRLIAARDRCSHREARLSLGTVKHGCLTCPYHGWTFGEAGRCVDVPSSGEGAAIPPGAHLDSLPVAERYGLVWFCPSEPLRPIPHLDVDEDPEFTRLNTAMQVWNCSASRLVDNILDIAHFPYTHRGTFGREQEKVVPNFSMKTLDETFTGYEYSVVINNEGDAKAMSGGGSDVIGLEMSTGFALPFSARSTMHYDNGIQQTLFMTAAPISADRSYYTFVLWRNDDVSATGREIVDFELRVAVEDREMLENIPGELALGRSELVDVQADKASVAWRRAYRSLLSGDADPG